MLNYIVKKFVANPDTLRIIEAPFPFVGNRDARFFHLK